LNNVNNRPLISGFTFIKHGLDLGYPILESILSISPLCDEVVINVGFDDPNCKNDDGTYDYLRSKLTDPKYIFLKSHWDPESKKKGLILSQQTNIALRACRGEFCQYIQGDEALHENDLKIILAGVSDMQKNPKIEGLVFNYVHFYGNVNIIKYTRNVYRREVRLIRNLPDIVSHLDAQGFRKKNGDKLWCKRIDACIYHYGWARQENIMRKKVASFGKLYHGSDYKDESFQYQKIWGLKQFTKAHPSIMQDWIKQHKNDLDILALEKNYSFKDLGLIISDWIEAATDYRIGEYKNYRLLGN